MPVTTIAWEKSAAKIIDQTLLPTQFKYLYIKDIETMWEAIRSLRIRGAPAIGIAAAFGVYLGIRKSNATTWREFRIDIGHAIRYLAASRPTAVNLFWSLDRMLALVDSHTFSSVPQLKKRILDEAKKMIDEDNTVCKKIGSNGAKLLKKNSTVLTHCNAGGLATARYGTALAVIYRAHEMKKNLHVYVDETRPLLQGARLTAWELTQNGIPATLICDNMAASLMAMGKIDAIIVGADRMATNGDFANKIGTYGLAVLAKHHNVPFYVALPFSTIDPKLADGNRIPIELRNPDEVRKVRTEQIAPEEMPVFNPAFDITPHKLVSAIITEKTVITPPFRKTLHTLLKKRENAA